MKIAEKIFDDLEQLKVGQTEIESHLCHQDLMLFRLLERTQPPSVSACRVVFRVTNESGLIIEEAESVEMKINQSFVCSVAFEDAAGNPANVDAEPEWSADPADLLTLEPDTDGMSVKVMSGTKAGSAQLLCKADADLGEGVSEITGMLAVTVLPGDAVTVRLNPGEVEDMPVANPIFPRKTP